MGKKILLILAGVIGVGALGCAALLFFGHKKGTEVQSAFYEAVLSGDVAAVKARFAPEVRGEIDDPVLAAWVAAVKEHLGAFTGISSSNFSTKVRTENGRDVVESTCVAEFEKGTAKSGLKLVDDLIVAWKTESDALPDNWFTELEDASYYVPGAEAFLLALFAGDGERARSLASEPLREKLAGKDFEDGLVRVKAFYGTTKSLAFRRHEFEAGPPQSLTLHFAPEGIGAAGSGEITVIYHFQGTRGVITSFNLPVK